MNDLIERIEAASGPDRALDHEIYEYLGSPVVRMVSATTHGTDLVNWAPFYTASVDAALTLVPEGWIVEIRRYFNRDGEYVASVQLVDSFSIGRGHDPDDEVSVSSRIVEKRQGIDPTPAAISAAALKARAYLKETNNAD